MNRNWRAKPVRAPDQSVACATQLRYGGADGWADDGKGQGCGELALYRQLRRTVPVVDAAIGKLVRLVGGFDVKCAARAAERALRRFLNEVPVGYGQSGIHQFLSVYLGGLLTDGRAIGEMVVQDGHLAGLCWGDAAQLILQTGDSPLETVICRSENGRAVPLPRQHLLLLTTLNPEPEAPFGVSMLRGIPFLAQILMTIYRTIGVNWERAGNVRYSVICRGGDENGVSAGARAEQMAEAWSEAMRENRQGVVRDFVAVGDVEIRVIGTDGQVMESEIPVRQLLEQIVARLGLPPFMLGLSWSSTERMSQQQADMLTSELWSLRRTVEPVLKRICRLFGPGGHGRRDGDRLG